MIMPRVHVYNIRCTNCIPATLCRLHHSLDLDGTFISMKRDICESSNGGRFPLSLSLNAFPFGTRKLRTSWIHHTTIVHRPFSFPFPFLFCFHFVSISFRFLLRSISVSQLIVVERWTLNLNRRFFDFPFPCFIFVECVLDSRPCRLESRIAGCSETWVVSRFFDVDSGVILILLTVLTGRHWSFGVTSWSLIIAPFVQSPRLIESRRIKSPLRI